MANTVGVVYLVDTATQGVISTGRMSDSAMHAANLRLEAQGSSLRWAERSPAPKSAKSVA